MTAYSYSAWNGLSKQERKIAPAGVSIGRNHVLNNPDRGAYWSGPTAALALASYVQEKLTSEDRGEAERFFNALKGTHREAVNADNRQMDRQRLKKVLDANRALSSTDFTLTDKQFDELYSATDDVNRIVTQSRAYGMRPEHALDTMVSRAAYAAVGMRESTAPTPYDVYLTSEEGRISQANLTQSLSQLYARITDENSEYEDALDVARGENFSKEDRVKNAELLMSIVKSVPFYNDMLNEANVDLEKNFSIRMDTVEEANMMETMLRWAAKEEQLPPPEQVNEVFNSWHDSGLIASPFEKRDIMRIGIILGNSENSNDTVAEVLKHDAGEEFGLPTQYFVLTTGNKGVALEQEIGGRPVIQAKAVATADGVEIEGLKDAPKDAIFMLNLSHEEAKDTVKRSNAANAFVGTAYSVSYFEGKTMTPLEAQAIHLAGSMRKLTYAQREDGGQFPKVFDKTVTEILLDNEGRVRFHPPEQAKDNEGKPILNEDGSPKIINRPMTETKDIYKHPLQALRDKAREIDAAADPQRYYAAGVARPREGVSAVVFDGARNYNAAIYKYAKGKDVIGDAYSRIPEKAIILNLDNDKNAISNFLREKAQETGRKVFYAEATRTYSYAENVSGERDRKNFFETEKTTELKIYDRPRSERGANPEEHEVRWHSPELQGSIVLVRGNAMKGAGDVVTQETKIAQEAMIDHSHTGVIFDDMQRDFHGATLIRLAAEMNKRFTVYNKEGESVALSEAREITRGNSQSITEQKDATVRKMLKGQLGRDNQGHNRNFSYGLDEPVAQMALKRIPGVTDEIAAKVGRLPFTLEELYKNEDKDILKVLHENGMKSESLKSLGKMDVWQNAMEYGLKQEMEADFLNAKFVPAGPLREKAGEADQLIPENKSAFVIGETVDKPVMAFIGNIDPLKVGGKGGKIQTPEDMLDREQLSTAVKAAVEKGFAIGVTLEDGIGKAVLEEARKIPDAEVFVASPSNVKAVPTEDLNALRDLTREGRAQIVMPASIAPQISTDKDGEEIITYSENRDFANTVLAKAASAAVVVQLADHDMAVKKLGELNKANVPVMVMVPNDTELATSEAYNGNIKLLNGSGTLRYEEKRYASDITGTWSNISDEVNEVVEHYDGVRRGNAGTFESIREGSESSPVYFQSADVSWGSAAKVLWNEESMKNLFEEARNGEIEPLGQKREKTVRELEKIFVERLEANSEVNDMFAQQQRMWHSAVEQDASRGLSSY